MLVATRVSHVHVSVGRHDSIDKAVIRRVIPCFLRNCGGTHGGKFLSVSRTSLPRTLELKMRRREGVRCVALWGWGSMSKGRGVAWPGLPRLQEGGRENPRKGLECIERKSGAHIPRLWQASWGFGFHAGLGLGQWGSADSVSKGLPSSCRVRKRLGASGRIEG